MSDPNILALDLAAQTGWAMGRVHDRTPIFGSERLAPPGASMGCLFSHYRSFLMKFATAEPAIDIITFEAPMTPMHMAGRTNINTIRMLMGLPAITEEFFFTMGGRMERYFDVREARVSDVRLHFLGSSRHKRLAAKALTIEACRRLGWKPQDDNAADALALWHYQASILNPRLALQASPLFRR